MDVWIEYAKQNGPWCAIALIVLYFVRQGGKWFATKVAEPIVNVTVAAVPAVAAAAVQMKDDLAEVKEATVRIEQKQEMFCAGRAPAFTRGEPAASH
jgi:hypothetical protein